MVNGVSRWKITNTPRAASSTQQKERLHNSMGRKVHNPDETVLPEKICQESGGGGVVGGKRGEGNSFLNSTDVNYGEKFKF